jgi:aspartyl-tRNA(Asn)/glutamyl-tRNA(Gln) amidotransferase subunit A
MNQRSSDYILAQMRREEYTERLSQVLQSVDALAAPTIPIVAPRVEENELVLGGKRESMRSALLRLTRPGNLSGLPAITLPCGFSREGLPVGLQLIGKRWDEAMVLRMAFAFEQATDWHRCFPCEPSSGI